jgi:hypothetical protein
MKEYEIRLRDKFALAYIQLLPVIGISPCLGGSIEEMLTKAAYKFADVSMKERGSADITGRVSSEADEAIMEYMLKTMKDKEADGAST